MGAVGGLLGVGGGLNGSGFNAASGTNGQQLNQSYVQNQDAWDQQQRLLNAIGAQNGLQNQSNVYGQLQKVVAGQGPNPAQAMLNQATGANVANQAALMAGQRGAGANVGLLARQAGQQGANIQQQAAGQGATMQANQSLGALGQAGQMANTMAANQIGQTNALASSAQNEQGILQGANTANNAVQGQLANTTMQGQQGLLSGALGGTGVAGKLLGALFADGGEVGSAFNPQSMFGQYLSNNNSVSSVPTFSSDNPGAKALSNLGKGSPTPKQDMNTNQAAATNTFNNQLAGNTMPQNMEASNFSGTQAAGGGKVPAKVSPGERFLKPNEAKAVADGKADPMKVGETIPGKAKVEGDSYSNDTVSKNLDVGGIVLPRSITQSKNPGSEAKRFVDSYMAKKRARS